MKATIPMVREYLHQALIDYELFQGPRGPIYLAFVDAKTDEKVYPTREELVFLKQYIDLRLSWLKDDERAKAKKEQRSADASPRPIGPEVASNEGQPPVGHEGPPPAPLAPPIPEPQREGGV